MHPIYLDDLAAGDVYELGPYEVTEAEIVAFAEQWDPLPFHTDPESAAETHDGLFASGYHTLAIATRLAVETMRKDLAAVAGLGLDDVTWHRPVRPGDVLSGTLEIVETRPSESRPGTGVLHQHITLVIESGEPVLSYEDFALVRRRDGDE